jgi:hypothetical protein
MGCACVKSDAVVKNQKLSNYNHSSSTSVKKEIIGGNKRESGDYKSNSE